MAIMLYFDTPHLTRAACLVVLSMKQELPAKNNNHELADIVTKELNSGSV